MGQGVMRKFLKETIVRIGKSEIYDDMTVCTYLRVRRRHLNEDRTKKRRGVDWDCVNDQAGMTREWIERYAHAHGINIHLESLKPIPADTRVVSVRLVGSHTNLEVASVERLSDGSRGYARVRNLQQFPIHIGECFDCLNVNGKLEWCGKLNNCRY